MKTKLSESIKIPTGITCHFSDKVLKCKKGSQELSRRIEIPGIEIKVHSDLITFECPKGNKSDFNKIMSTLAHVKNIFKGLDSKFEYKLQACNVHFPMTLKVDKNRLAINNFLGEKQPRFALILPNVEVDIKGQNIVLSSHDREAAGQTAANIEKATKVRNRDRRIFQDGIYIVEKPGAEQ